MYYDKLNSEEQVSYLIKPILEVLQAAGGDCRRTPLRPDGMGMPQLERSVDCLLSKPGGGRPDGMDDLAAKRRQDPSAGWIVT